MYVNIPSDVVDLESSSGRATVDEVDVSASSFDDPPPQDEKEARIDRVRSAVTQILALFMAFSDLSPAGAVSLVGFSCYAYIIHTSRLKVKPEKFIII